MPIAPYTWVSSDWISAWRLQQELRNSGGQPFAANGVAWHAAKPVYRSFTSTTPAASTSWKAYSGTTGWSSVTDTSPLLGSRADPTAIGEVSATGITNSGGTNAIGSRYGGYFFFFNSMPWTSGAGTAATSVGGGAPTAYGTFQTANKAPQITQAFELGDWGSQAYQGFYESTALAVAPTTASAGTDGSGSAVRSSGFWTSVYTVNGITQGSLPTVTPSWALNSSVTSALLNTNIKNVMNLLNMPPVLRIASPVATSCASATYVPVAYTGATLSGGNISTYAQFNPTTGTFTAPLNGLYLIIALAGYDSTANSSVVATGLTVNGTTNYMGPPMLSAASQSIRASKAQIFSLNAGDTVSQFAIQYTGSTISTSTSAPALMIAIWLGYNSTPGVLPSAPDITYQFKAGLSPANTLSAFNSNFANDLLFLTQRPYCLAYQTTAQTGIPGSGSSPTPTPITMQSNTGIVHGDSAVSYGGWSTNTFTAPRSGFYLCVQETFMAVPSLTTAPDYAAGFQLTPGGSVAQDFYGQQSAIAGLSYGGGASAVAIYYLNAGDTIQPVIQAANTSSTTTSTFVNTGSNPVQASHFEAVWISG